MLVNLTSRFAAIFVFMIIDFHLETREISSLAGPEWLIRLGSGHSGAGKRKAALGWIGHILRPTSPPEAISYVVSNFSDLQDSRLNTTMITFIFLKVWDVLIYPLTHIGHSKVYLRYCCETICRCFEPVLVACVYFRLFSFQHYNIVLFLRCELLSCRCNIILNSIWIINLLWFNLIALLYWFFEQVGTRYICIKAQTYKTSSC